MLSSNDLIKFWSIGWIKEPALLGSMTLSLLDQSQWEKLDDGYGVLLITSKPLSANLCVATSVKFWYEAVCEIVFKFVCCNSGFSIDFHVTGRDDLTIQKQQSLEIVVCNRWFKNGTVHNLHLDLQQSKVCLSILSLSFCHG